MCSKVLFRRHALSWQLTCWPYPPFPSFTERVVVAVVHNGGLFIEEMPEGTNVAGLLSQRGARCLCGRFA